MAEITMSRINRQDCYQVITDIEKLKEFIDWLPELGPDETFYLCLFARSKYCKHIAHIKSDKAQLKRFTSNKERLLNKIKQLECPIGAYTVKESNKEQEIAVPQESLSLYITINPRSLISATRSSVRKLLDLAMQPYNGYHPYQEVMSEIQVSKAKSKFVTFDFDVDKSVWPSIYQTIPKHINKSAISVVETRGGYHLIVEPAKVNTEYANTWYQSFTKILSLFSSDKDNKGDIMLPVPGTYQGGFTPRFL